MKFRKKPVVIEAEQFLTWDIVIVRDWLADAYRDGVLSIHKGHAIIKTLEGDMRVEVGDWIIKGVKGEIYSCKDEIFKMTYEPAE